MQRLPSMYVNLVFQKLYSRKVFIRILKSWLHGKINLNVITTKQPLFHLSNHIINIYSIICCNDNLFKNKMKVTLILMSCWGRPQSPPASSHICRLVKKELSECSASTGFSNYNSNLQHYDSDDGSQGQGDLPTLQIVLQLFSRRGREGAGAT